MIPSRTIARALVSLNESQKTEKVVADFMRFIRKYHLEGQFPAILAHLKSLLEKQKNDNTLFVHTPHPVPETILNDVKKFVGVPHDAHVENRKGVELIGGFLAYWKDQKIDASVLHTLGHMRETLLSD